MAIIDRVTATASGKSSMNWPVVAFSRREARALMEELVRLGNAELARSGEAARIAGDAVIERMFAMTDVMGASRPSTLIDYLEGRSLEVEAIFGEPLRRAHALGEPAPRLELMTALLRSLAGGPGPAATAGARAAGDGSGGDAA